jgi:hypothetical protein
MSTLTSLDDVETLHHLQTLGIEERIRQHRVANVKSILVIFSSRSVAFDIDSLKQKIKMSYPEAKVYFESTLAYPMGERAPEKLDLVIDFTGPGQRHKWFYARKLRSRARVTVGRNAWFFREHIYDRIFNEQEHELPEDLLAREKFVQKEVLELAGVPVSTQGTLGADLSKKIATKLPRLK